MMLCSRQTVGTFNATVLLDLEFHFLLILGDISIFYYLFWLPVAHIGTSLHFNINIFRLRIKSFKLKKL